ncbi:MAG: DUF1844 domain-containing protein [Bacteroidota bacterium]
MNQDERYTALFGGLVTMFQTAALQQMGKIKNPATDSIERDLDQAGMSIDMLEMIQWRMKGNLKREEEDYLMSILRDLKLNYVDELAKQKPGSVDVPGETEKK